MPQKLLRPDAKGRITLGSLAKGVSGYALNEMEDGKIILEPYTEIPAREKWIFKDKRLLKRIKQGIKDATEGRLSKKGSFAKFIEKDDE